MAKSTSKQSQSKPLAKKSKPPKPQAELPTAGNYHDLLEIYHDINQKYFDDKLQARISWGRRPPIPARHHKKFNSGLYHTTERLITIHRALDRAWVPRFIVEYTVFHEMLHIKFPPQLKNNRSSFHYKQFRAAEADFADYHRAEHWEKTNLDNLMYF